jgi:hypothetical protein
LSSKGPEPAAADLDTLEKALSSEFDTLTQAAMAALHTGIVANVQEPYATMTDRREQAKYLADHGRPAVSKRLEAMITDLGAAMKTMGATDAMLRKADVADQQAAVNARSAVDALWKQTLQQRLQ